MRIQFIAPTSLECVLADKVVPSCVEHTPIPVKGKTLIHVGHVRATGKTGRESTASILFNTRTGEFRVQQQAGDEIEFDFDKPTTVTEAVEEEDDE